MTKSRKRKEETNGVGFVIWGLLLIALGGFFGAAATTAGSIASAIPLLIFCIPFTSLGILYVLSFKFGWAKKIVDALGGNGVLTG
ncbi:MAG TPA: hypothetical protein VGM08_02845 [Candidatus Saccharimonadales bacterium]|jgi:hypothetical protein